MLYYKHIFIIRYTSALAYFILLTAYRYLDERVRIKNRNEERVEHTCCTRIYTTRLRLDIIQISIAKMAALTIPSSSNNAVRIGVDLPSITTTTKTEFVGFDGKIIKST